MGRDLDQTTHAHMPTRKARDVFSMAFYGGEKYIEHWRNLAFFPPGAGLACRVRVRGGAVHTTPKKPLAMYPLGLSVRPSELPLYLCRVLQHIRSIFFLQQDARRAHLTFFLMHFCIARARGGNDGGWLGRFDALPAEISNQPQLQVVLRCSNFRRSWWWCEAAAAAVSRCGCGCGCRAEQG